MCKLKEIREKLNLSQDKLAKLAGITLRHFQNIEHGRCNPRIDTINKLTRVLVCTVEELFPAGGKL